MEVLARQLVSWIREQVNAAKAGGTVVGMSGGLDSSVVAVLCQRAFPDGVLGVIMPCYTPPRDVEDALVVARSFAIPTRTLVLDEVFDALVRKLRAEGQDPTTQRLAEANLKARLRMATLYYFANRLGYLVAGTGNRSELAVGYFTKYGDGGVDILPLGSLLKTQVRALATYLGIPQSIIDKPPSAGLWAGQTDEGEMGVTYAELDTYLTTGEASPQVKARIESMILASAHKRSTPPIPPRLLAS